MIHLRYRNAHEIIPNKIGFYMGWMDDGLFIKVYWNGDSFYNHYGDRVSLSYWAHIPKKEELDKLV